MSASHGPDCEALDPGPHEDGYPDIDGNPTVDPASRPIPRLEPVASILPRVLRSIRGPSRPMLMSGEGTREAVDRAVTAALRYAEALRSAPPLYPVACPRCATQWLEAEPSGQWALCPSCRKEGR